MRRRVSSSSKTRIGIKLTYGSRPPRCDDVGRRYLVQRRQTSLEDPSRLDTTTGGKLLFALCKVIKFPYVRSSIETIFHRFTRREKKDRRHDATMLSEAQYRADTAWHRSERISTGVHCAPASACDEGGGVPRVKIVSQFSHGRSPN